MEPVYTPLVRLGEGLITLMGWRMRGAGLERIPREGPAVLATNHVSYLDPFVAGWAVTRRGRLPRFLAKRELFEVPVFGRALRSMRHVPVDRGGRAAESMTTGARLLADGEVIVVFPEATISTSFVPADPKPGAARLAMAAGAPLLPAALWGGQRIWTKNRPRRLRRRVPMVVLVGAPVPYEPDEDAAAVTRRLWRAVGELVEHAQRTYPDRPDDDDRWWLPRHLGGSAPSVEEADVLRHREAANRRTRRADERLRGRASARRRLRSPRRRAS